MVLLEPGVQRNAQQPALRGGVDRQLQHRPGNRSVDDMFHFSTGLLGDKEIVIAKERHGNRLAESADSGPYGQVGIRHRGRWRLALGRDGPLE